VKQKQLSPTVTVTVAALVTVDGKARSEAIVATINAKPREEVFIALVFGYSHRCHAVELQTIWCDTQ
jgi:hypothetical protein